MARPAIELADIVRQQGAAYRERHRGSLSYQQLRVLHAIEVCRTATLGGHLDACTQCGQTRLSYNSCRNRHCPKCQSLARAQWLADRQADLLPVDYFHVVFSVPAEIAAVAYQNKALVYGLLFRATAETLQQIAADPQHLGAEIGFLAVLHTWGQTLTHHPHIHCVVPGGGVSREGTRWVSCRPRFFLSVRVLSRRFRHLLLTYLAEAYRANQLRFFADLQRLQEPAAWGRYLQQARTREWVVYAKPPFGGPAQVLEYLGRYTHRVAIANQRLLSLEDGQVRFRWKDYRDQGQSKVMTLSADEFLRRFLLHVLPPGFQRIRQYGWLSNRGRTEKLALCRRLLAAATSSSRPAGRSRPRPSATVNREARDRCPACGQGTMVWLGFFLPAPPASCFLAPNRVPLDSS